MKRIAAAIILLTLLLTPAHVSATGSCTGTTYTVKNGDTLWSISKKCNIAWTVLLGVNYQIEDPEALWPGEVIRLEAEAKVPTDNPIDPGAPPIYDGRLPGIQEDGTYLVRSGDSLARIAEIYHTSVDELRRLNPEIGDNNLIFPGQSLVLPPGAADLPGDALREGFVGVPALQIYRGRSYEVNITNFPPFADLEVRLGKVGAVPARTYPAITDAMGNAFVTVVVPYTAYAQEKWQVQVVTTEFPEVREGFSALMTVVY